MPYATAEAETTLEVTGIPWWEQEFLGIPVWGWIAGGVGVAIIGAVAYEMRKEERMMRLLMAR